MPRIVIQLTTGEYVSSYYDTRDECIKVITEWRDRQQERIRDGKADEHEHTLFMNNLVSDGRCSLALWARSIVGMYLPADQRDDVQSNEVNSRLAESNRMLAEAQARIASVMEKGTTEGNEWKDDS